MISTNQITPSTRRVLSELNANSITAGVKPVAKGSYIHKPLYESIVGPRPAAVMDLNSQSPGSAKRPAVAMETSSGDIEEGSQEGSNKRFRASIAPMGLESAEVGSFVEHERVRSISPTAAYSSSPLLSPASSNESTVPNDSQNTTLTEIDLESSSPARRVMSSDEIRQKAKLMKLRLRLASYKIQTNQIDIPISQLKIKTTPSSGSPHPPPSLHRSSSQTSQRRTPLPNISLQEPSSEKPRSRSPESITSSPPRPSSISSRKGAFTTPGIPQQREYLPAPNIGSPAWGGRGDLVSSNVQKSAADSLLTLGRPSFSAEFKRSF